MILILLCSFLFKVLLSPNFSYFIAIIYLGIFYYKSALIRKNNKKKDEVIEDWKNLFNALPYGIAIQTQENGKCEYCNTALCDLLEVNDPILAYKKIDKLKEEVVKKRFDERAKIGGGTFSEINIQKESNIFQSWESEKGIFTSISFEEVGIRNKLYNISDKTIKWKGQQACLSTLKDITEMRKVEMIKAENQIKTRILRSLSHELRTPINCILLSLEHCKEKLATDEESLANINIALANSNILLNKYNDILVNNIIINLIRIF